ncbi:MAG TPA: hypothetical protein VFS19_02820 [Planctomycetota bacterium]|nr:hypothetical protein [Planctomycetota bacterium]
MTTFTPQMESYVRQQLALEKEPWWIATELARMANVEQSVARGYVDGLASEVRPRMAWGYIPMLLAGLVALATGLALLYFGILIIAWLMIPIGVAVTTSSFYSWRRLRRSSSK